METALDLTRWREAPKGVGYRRWTIVSTGLRQLLSTRFFKILLYVAWSMGVGIAALGFAFSQSIATGGWLESLARNISPRAEALVTALGGLVTLYPDICVTTVFTLIFWLHSYAGLVLSLLALTIVVPQIVTRDRASNALTIYLSRPLTSVDYLAGKFGIILGILLLLWTGPLVLGWLLSMVLSSERDFIVYSFTPFLRALAFNGIALGALAPIALGVSALSRSSRGTIMIWLGLWLVAGTVAKHPALSDRLRTASFSYDLGEIRHRTFKLDAALREASADLPILSEEFAAGLKKSSQRVEPRNVRGAVIGLGVLGLLSAAVFFRRIRPE